MLSFVIVMGSKRFYVVGYYIPPNDLCTLPQVKQALNECPKGHTPLLIVDLNVNLCAPQDKRDEQIAEVVEDPVQTLLSMIPWSHAGEIYKEDEKRQEVGYLPM
jgi:hypothetical protein